MDESSLWSVDLGRGLGPLELGLERSALRQRLQEAQIEIEPEDDEPHIFGTDADIILTLAPTSHGELLQIAIEDDRAHFGSQEVIDRRLHEITDFLQVHPEETVWRTDLDPDDSLPGKPPAAVETVSDIELLESGTLWIKPFGLGLRMREGEIAEIYLRSPDNCPTVGVGSLTPKQLEFSRRDDLPTFLRYARQQQRPRSGGCFRPLSTLACFGLIGWIVFQAAQYQKRWHDAPAVMAKVVAVRPDDPDQIPTEFIVEYRDPTGVEHRIPLGLADVYVPKAVGDEIELRYLPEDPQHPLAPGRIKDVAFVKYFPYAIGVFAGFLVLQIAAAIVRKLLPNSRPVA